MNPEIRVMVDALLLILVGLLILYIYEHGENKK